MEPQSIFAPFFAQMVLTFVIWVYMYARRIPFIVSSRMRPEQMTPAGFAQLSPSAVSNPSDNLKNLFELPTLFYCLCLLLYVTDRVDPVGLYAAWWFVFFRYCHSVVHCTFNHILLRFAMYALSAAALWFMVLRAVAWILWPRA